MYVDISVSVSNSCCVFRSTPQSQVLPHRGLPANTRLAADAQVHEDVGHLTAAPLRARFSVASRPHAAKAASGGEDAHFVHAPIPGGEQGGLVAFGVADGVGSWSFEKGIDGSQYARALMSASLQAAASASRSSEGTVPDAHALLQRAWSALEAQSASAAPAVGATTACVCVLDARRRELSAANVGDSGFVVLRRVSASSSESDYKGWRIVFTSPQQLVYFNCPFQVHSAAARAPLKPAVTHRFCSARARTSSRAAGHLGLQYERRRHPVSLARGRGAVARAAPGRRCRCVGNRRLV